MIVQLSAKASLFLYVRTHSQVAYYLNLADPRRAANDNSLPSLTGEVANGANTNIVPLGELRTRLRG